jgi:hypothetical protein
MPPRRPLGRQALRALTGAPVDPGSMVPDADGLVPRDAHRQPMPTCSGGSSSHRAPALTGSGVPCPSNLSPGHGRRDGQRLWKRTEATSHRKIRTLTPQSGSALADQLTTWYYHEGGIALSEEARDKFFAARRTLEPATAQQNLPPWRKSVVKAFSALRTALCEDMNSRRGPRLRELENRDLELDAQIEQQAE